MKGSINMKYQVLETIKTVNWEGVIFEDEKGNKKMTSGIYTWEARPKRIAKCQKVEINKELFLERFNKYNPYAELLF
jgi:hypothetical protein